MPEVIIKYKKPETLKILRGLAKYFDFKVSETKEKKNQTAKVSSVTIIPASEKFDPSAMTELFTKRNIDAEKLRKEAWQRNR